jgi:hypothetical protein
VRLALAPQSRVRQRVEDGATVRTHLAEGAALSPDGRRIAFTALGTLYVADRDGGAPRTLFSGNAFQPAWSPDGQTIAFVRWSAEHGGSVWTIPATVGPPREWGKAGAYWSEPRWSRDGTTIMALRAAQFDRLHAENELDPAWPVDVVALSGPGAAPRVIAHGAGLRHLQQTDDGAWYVTSGGALARIEPDGTLRPRARVVARAAGQYVKEPGRWTSCACPPMAAGWPRAPHSNCTSCRCRPATKRSTWPILPRAIARSPGSAPIRCAGMAMACHGRWGRSGTTPMRQRSSGPIPKQPRPRAICRYNCRARCPLRPKCCAVPRC